MESASYIRQALLDNAIVMAVYYEQSRRAILNPELEEYRRATVMLVRWINRIRVLTEQYLDEEINIPSHTDE